jgi:hypothetical protein
MIPSMPDVRVMARMGRLRK